MTLASTDGSAVIVGHHWAAEAIVGGFQITVSGGDPDALDRAVRYLIQPAWRLEYWDLELLGYAEDHAEVWLMLGQFGNDLVTL